MRRVSRATHPPAVLTAGIPGQRKGSFANKGGRVIVILHLNAVVSVITHSTRSIQRILTQSVLVAKNREPGIRAPQDLPSNPWAAVESSIRLPSIHEPGLDLEMFSREDLDAHSIEEPRGIGRDIRGLVCPVVKVVIAEQPDVGHENAGINVDAVHHAKMVSTIGFRNVAVSSVKIPLSTRRAGIVAWSSLRIHS